MALLWGEVAERFDVGVKRLANSQTTQQEERARLWLVPFSVRFL